MKYIKPTSLTWWAAIGLLITGIVDTIQNKSLSPHVAEALAAIGLRASIP